MLNINFDYDWLIGEGVNYMTHTSIIFNGENTFVIPFEYRRLLASFRISMARQTGQIDVIWSIR